MVRLALPRCHCSADAATKGHRFAARYGAEGLSLDAAKGTPEFPEGYAIGRKSQLLQTGLALLKTSCQ